MKKPFSFALLVGATLTSSLPAQWTATENAQWRPLDMSDQRVLPGSALDFSFIAGNGEAGQHGFALINGQGQFVFENQPDVAPRFFCASQLPGVTQTQAEIEAVAEQIRLAGYNVVRAHFLDQLLMWNSSQALVFNPAMVARWHQFTYALKRRGIYLCVDASSSWASFTTLKSWDAGAWDVRMKSRLYYDEEGREQWKTGVRQILESVNPHTGLALKDEPQMIAIALRNESGLDYLMGSRGYDPDLVIPFRAWLTARYGTDAALSAGWGSALPAGQTLATVTLPTTTGNRENTRDLLRFFTDMERETYEWGANYLRQLGVRVPIYDYNIGGSLQTALSRDVMPFVDNHAYHDHSSGAWLEPGMKIANSSSLADRLPHFRWIAGTRHWGRPLFATEFGIQFWNRWRHEAGLSGASYAALQGWQLICQHAAPVSNQLTPNSEVRITPFQIAPDPTARAVERMSALLFARGDVAPSPHRVEVRLDAGTLFERFRTQNALPSHITSTALLTGLGIRVMNHPGAAPRAPYEVDIALSPDGTVEVTTVGDAAQQANETADGDALSRQARHLRTSGILARENRTDTCNGIFESDTRQIFLDTKKGAFSVNTARSQGASLPAGPARIRVGDMMVENTGPAMALMLSSLTNLPLAQTDRALLIVAGDTLNSGMSFTDATRRELVTVGTPPILAEVLRVKLRAPQLGGHTWRAYALTQNGSRREEIPVTTTGGALELTLDTGTLTHGPTTYFELAAQN